MNIMLRIASAIMLLPGLMGSAQSAEDVIGWAAGDTPVVVQGGTLVDVRNGDLISNSNIIIIGDRIESVGGGPVPQGASVIDASGK